MDRLAFAVRVRPLHCGHLCSDTWTLYEQRTIYGSIHPPDVAQHLSPRCHLKPLDDLVYHEIHEYLSNNTDPNRFSPGNEYI